MNPLKISDLSLRDGFQSLFATRGRTDDMALIAKFLDDIGFSFVEVWGGATFDVMHRSLYEDPWERIRKLGRHFKKTPMSMILRGKNLVGYHPYPDDVISSFIERTAANGISIIRAFDPLNDMDNLKLISKKINSEEMHLQGAVLFSLTSENGLKDEKVYTKDYYVEKIKQLEDLGAKSLCLKDTAGILKPYDSFELISVIKKVTSLPVYLHAHSGSGLAAMTHLKASEAGVDGIDTCLSPFAYRSSHPASEPLYAALKGSERDPGLDLNAMVKAVDFIEENILPKYRMYFDEDKISVVDPKILLHHMPQSLILNIEKQLKDNMIMEREKEAFEKVPNVRKDLGQIPMITPLTQILAVQTVNNLLFDDNDGDYNLLSDQVKSLIKGEYGKTAGIVSKTLKDKIEEKYPDYYDSVLNKRIGLDEAARNIKGLAADIEDELIYALFPRTGKRFLKWKYGREDVNNSTGAISLEEAKKRLGEIKKLKQGESAEEETFDIPEKGPQTRSFNVYVGDDFFEVSVDPGENVFFSKNFKDNISKERISEYIESKKVKVKNEKETKLEKSLTELVLDEDKNKEKDFEATGDYLFLRAPMPGSIVSLRKKKGDHVRMGETILVLEAMKMENPLKSPVDGILKDVRCSGGDQVPKDSVLCVIDSAG